jgi:hypothetical protein
MATTANVLRLQILSRMAAGVVVTAIPIGLWWKSAHNERLLTAEDVRTRIRVPGQETSDDRLLERCQPGDVILFDRRCEKCAAGPWAAVACLAQRRFLCDEKRGARTVDTGKFDHIGTYRIGLCVAWYSYQQYSLWLRCVVASEWSLSSQCVFLRDWNI